MNSKLVRLLAVLTILTLVAAACGARVDEQQLQAVGGGGSGGGVGVGVGGTGGTGGGTGTDDALGGTDFDAGTGGDVTGGDPAAGGGGAAGGDPAAGGGGDPAAGGGGGGGGGDAAPQAPQGGNGGATDIGVTGDTVLLGNVATLSGPVPGLFQGAVIGAQAAVAYQNSKGGLFGRRFKLEVRDDQFDTGQNRAQTIDLLGKVFAFVGSFSLYDDAAAKQITESGIPDVSYSLSPGRRRVPNNFSVEPSPPRGAPTGSLNYFKAKFPEAVKSVGTIFSDIARASHEDYKRAAESVGWSYTYERGVAATETDFTADVIRMRQSGVKMVFLVAVDVNVAARVAKAMQQQNFEPEVFMVQGAAYDTKMLQLAGDAAEGMYSAQPYSMFIGEDAGAIPEVTLFNQWLQKVKPGYKPDLFAAFSWASGRLLFQAIEKAGPNADRAAVRKAIQEIGTFSANNLLAPANPGTKEPPTCYLIAQVQGGKFVRHDTPVPYRCGDGPFLTFEK